MQNLEKNLPGNYSTTGLRIGVDLANGIVTTACTLHVGSCVYLLCVKSDCSGCEMMQKLLKDPRLTDVIVVLGTPSRTVVLSSGEKTA